MIARRAAACTLVLPLALALAACGGGTEPPGPPAALTAVAPGPFTDTVGTALPAPLQVRVTDANGRAVPRVAVVFTANGGSGSVGDGSAGGPSFTDSTDVNGTAEAVWVLGTTAGPQGASASVAGLAVVGFAATAIAGPPAGALVDESSAFVAPAGSATDEPLAVRVVDAYDNPVAAAVVSWAALTAGAAVAGSSSVTDDAGLATTGASLGTTPGVYLFRATVPGASVDTLGVLAVTIVEDPVGDQFSTQDPAYDSHDATRFGALVVDQVLVLYAKFAGNIGPVPTTGPMTREALLANYDLDLDGDSLTGFYTLRQCIGGPPLGFGADAFVDLTQASEFLSGQSGIPTGAVAVVRVDSLLDADRCQSRFAGAILATVPVYQPTSATLVIPLSFLNDDGAFDATTLFGHPGTGTVTDIVPDSLAWGFTPMPIPTAAAAEAPTLRWDYLSRPAPTGVVRRVSGMPLTRVLRR